MDTTSLEQAIAQAYTYAYPVYAVAHTRGKALRGPHNPQGAAPNTVQHERHLSDHRSRWITAPNNDTLYSNAWLDLSAGPVRLRVGRQPEGRYWSLAFMDAYTNHFAVVGQRLDGVGPVDLVVVAPGQTPPPRRGPRGDSPRTGRVGAVPLAGGWPTRPGTLPRHARQLVCARAQQWG